MPCEIIVIHVWVYIIPKETFKRPNHVIKVQPWSPHCSVTQLPRRRVCVCARLCLVGLFSTFQTHRAKELSSFSQSLFQPLFPRPSRMFCVSVRVSLRNAMSSCRSLFLL